MRVRLERNWQRATTRVYVLVDRGRDGRHLLTIPEPGHLLEVELKEGAATSDEGGYLFELPDYVLEAIVAEASGILPPDRAQAAHLADTISVRDRLLALVERPTP